MASSSWPSRSSRCGARVALKIIKLGMDTQEVIARFEAERQALAMMDHPNIAQGVRRRRDAVGRPYFVMELVRGVPITEYCDQDGLAVARAARRCSSQVCQAIQHAHQKGIIHRDIKPSNILVTLHDGVPVPKVIDFGIAKATQSSGSPTDTLFTQAEQMIGTPLYMSPEQAEMSGAGHRHAQRHLLRSACCSTNCSPGARRSIREEWSIAATMRCAGTIREEEPLRPSAALRILEKSALQIAARRRGIEPAEADARRSAAISTGSS